MPKCPARPAKWARCVERLPWVVSYLMDIRGDLWPLGQTTRLLITFHFTPSWRFFGDPQLNPPVRGSRYDRAPRTRAVGAGLSGAVEPKRAHQTRQRRATGEAAGSRHLPAHRFHR